MGIDDYARGLGRVTLAVAIIMIGWGGSVVFSQPVTTWFAASATIWMTLLLMAALWQLRGSFVVALLGSVYLLMSMLLEGSRDKGSLSAMPSTASSCNGLSKVDQNRLRSCRCCLPIRLDPCLQAF